MKMNSEGDYKIQNSTEINVRYKRKMSDIRGKVIHEGNTWKETDDSN